MAHRVTDRLRFQSTTTGAGALTVVAGGVTGHLGMEEALTSNGDTALLFAAMGDDFEVFLGTRNSATELARTTIYASSNGGSAVNWGAGVKDISSDIPARFAEFLNQIEIAVASAGTCDIGAVNGGKIEITGTTTITSFGTSAHKLRLVRFSGALTLTHNATSLILPGAANITTAAGDTAVFTSDGSGNWRCWSYELGAEPPYKRASTTEARAGTSSVLAVTPAGLKASTGWWLIQAQTASAVSSLDFTTGIDSTYDRYVFVVSGLLPATDNVSLWLRISQDGGSSWKSGASDYQWVRTAVYSGAATDSIANDAADSEIELVDSILDNNTGRGLEGEITLSEPDSGRFKMFRSAFAFVSDAGGAANAWHWDSVGYYAIDGNAINGVRFLYSSGNIASGTIALYGLRRS